MDPGLLDAIVHKDEDATIMAVDPTTNTIIYKTSDPHMQLGAALPNDDNDNNDDAHGISLADDTLLERQTQIPIVSVPVQVARTVFIVHAIVCFIVMTLGFIPFYILDYDETPKWIIIAVCVCSFVCVAAYALLIVFPTNGWILLGFLYTLLCWVGSLSALTRSLAPLQAASISFAQCIVVLCYAVKSRASLNEWYVFWFTFLTGVGGWLSGIYVLIQQHDWIAGTLLFFFVCFANPPYMALQVFLTSRFSVAEKHKLSSIVHFYIDPVALVIAHWKSLYVNATVEPTPAQ